MHQNTIRLPILTCCGCCFRHRGAPKHRYRATAAHTFALRCHYPLHKRDTALVTRLIVCLFRLEACRHLWKLSVKCESSLASNRDCIRGEAHLDISHASSASLAYGPFRYNGGPRSFFEKPSSIFATWRKRNNTLAVLNQITAMSDAPEMF